MVFDNAGLGREGSAFLNSNGKDGYETRAGVIVDAYFGNRRGGTYGYGTILELSPTAHGH